MEARDFFPILGHRRQDLFKLLDRIARRDLTPPQFATARKAPSRSRTGQYIESSSVDLADPVAEGLCRGQLDP
jgi:hypothetical protein